MSMVYAFVFKGIKDWRKSSPDDWEMEMIELDGDEKVLGHRRLDEAICKVLQTSDGTIVAISK